MKMVRCWLAKPKYLVLLCHCHNADNMTRSCKNIDKIFKYNDCQTNSPKNIDHTASDAYFIKGYKLTVILASKSS